MPRGDVDLDCVEKVTGLIPRFIGAQQQALCGADRPTILSCAHACLNYKPCVFDMAPRSFDRGLDAAGLGRISD